MIIEKMRSREDFTDNEMVLADYILANGYEIKNMSISELADATYTSPATITRFCRKLGLQGYKDFSIRYSLEYEESRKQESIDTNLPFSRTDSFEKITRNMGSLNASTINRIINEFDYDQLKRIVYRMHDADVINVFGVGISAIVALDFQTKMVRLGKQVNVNLNSILQDGYALSSTDNTVNLVISQSGETPQILECIRILANKNSYIVSVTANTQSTAAKYSNEIITARTEEDDSFTVKIESFASYNATHFILDCLYCFLFRLDYDKNVELCRQKARAIHDAGGK